MTLEMRILPDGREVKMWQLPNGEWIEVGDKYEVGREVGCSGKTYTNYVRAKSPAADPAPGPVGVDPRTRRDLFPMERIRAWHKRRPGPGDHGGVGARLRWDRVAAKRRAEHREEQERQGGSG